MSERRDYDYLGDIQEAVERIAAYATDMTFEQFLKDTKTQDAIVRNLEVIGEAAKNISGSLRETNPRIPWKDLAGMRDKMIHHYFGIDYEIVWKVIKEELPALLPGLENTLPGETG